MNPATVMNPTAIKKLLGMETSRQEIEAALARLDEQEREFRASLGVPADKARARVRGFVADARQHFDALHEDTGSIPDSLRHANVLRVVEALVVSGYYEEAALASIDRATERGRFDSTPQAQIDAQLEAFKNQREGLEHARKSKVKAEEEELLARERREHEAAAEKALAR